MIEITPVYWENIIALLTAYAILALIIERALYHVFHTKLWGKIEEKIDEHYGGDFFDLKPWVSVAVSLAVVFKFELDMVASIYKFKPQYLTMVLTALFISGGSTAFYEFFKKMRQLKKHEMEAKGIKKKDT